MEQRYSWTGRGETQHRFGIAILGGPVGPVALTRVWGKQGRPFIWLSLLVCLSAWVSCILSTAGTKKNKGETVIAVKPGYYRGTFLAKPVKSEDESECILAKDGSYQYLGIRKNEVLFTLSGQWRASSDSFFQTQVFGFDAGDDGFILAHDSLPDKASPLRWLSDTSFEMKEIATFLDGTSPSQSSYENSKTDWVHYSLTDTPDKISGVFDFIQETGPDSVYVIAFDLTDTLQFVRESAAITSTNREIQFRQTGLWRQVGSFFFTSHLISFSPDSINELTVQDTLPGELAYRVKDLSTNALTIWSGLEWDEYNRKP
jgi:hypothetical protein